HHDLRFMIDGDAGCGCRPVSGSYPQVGIAGCRTPPGAGRLAPMTSRRAHAPTRRLREPADRLAATPYTVGYHPTARVVVLAMRAKQLVFAARDDLPTSPVDARINGNELVQIMRRERATGVIVVGYGEDERVRPAVLSIRDACVEAGLCVLEVLRAHE